MNFAVALDQLQKARQLVKHGEQCVLNQRSTIAGLERRGSDVLEETVFLECLEKMQERYEAHRDRLEQHVLALVKPEHD